MTHLQSRVQHRIWNICDSVNSKRRQSTKSIAVYEGNPRPESSSETSKRLEPEIESSLEHWPVKKGC